MKKFVSRFLVIISIVGILIPSSFASAATLGTFNLIGGETVGVQDTTLVGYGYQTSGDNVKILQAALSVSGYNPGVIDGYFGNNTLGALNNFQDRYFGYHDGIAGPKTFGKLLQTCSGKTLPIHLYF